METFYLTTAIPYVNAKPHVGHALEFVQADAIARHQKLLGKDVCLLSGSDENALKNVRAAEAAGRQVAEFVDANAKSFRELAGELNVRFDVFQKGSDTVHHFSASQNLWKRCAAAGDIYKQTYEGLYCVGCEAFYTPEELNEKGECFEHPGKKLETVSEENYFFRLSKYQKQLTDLISSDTLRIFPEFRKNEVLSFLKQPLRDISISRTNERARNWGVPVPDDPAQRMYVWFDALNIYQSGIGFGWDDAKYRKWWPADLHVIGKGIIRFHAVYWPAFLMSAGLEVPKSLFVHGYFTVNGRKMSKSIGNVIDPLHLIKKYGSDALRYYFLREIPAFSDGDFSERRFRELYNADLANGIGNLAARVAKLAIQTDAVIVPQVPAYAALVRKHDGYRSAMEEYRLHDAVAEIWDAIRQADKHLDDTEPWKQTGRAKTDSVNAVIPVVQQIAVLLQPFLPDTAEKILEQYASRPVKAGKPLFPRMLL